MLSFILILEQAGISPSDVRLLRHADRNLPNGRSFFELWRNDRGSFDQYQRVQSSKRRSDFGEATYWAAFASTFEGKTVFVGLFSSKLAGFAAEDMDTPDQCGVDRAGEYDFYDLVEQPAFADLAGRLYVDWGPGMRSWVQRADRQNKLITELRSTVEDPPFPGFSDFIQSLSALSNLPAGWKDSLRSSRGVYLLTCPNTKEHYVGKAEGADGFLGRWLAYAADGHGGNLGLKSREVSDYRISILETAGSAASSNEISAMENRWKHKLQSREIGLNHN